VLSSAAVMVAAGQVCTKVLRWGPRSGALLGMGLVLPAFLLFKWACREQEVVADTAAGRAGYAMGVREREHRVNIA
jgi:hypothetical protein